MKRKGLEERLSDALQKRASTDQEIARLSSRISGAETKREKHRRFCAGEAVLAEAAEDPVFAAQLWDILDRRLTRVRERAAFDLDRDRLDVFNAAAHGHDGTGAAAQPSSGAEKPGRPDPPRPR